MVDLILYTCGDELSDLIRAILDQIFMFDTATLLLLDKLPLVSSFKLYESWLKVFPDKLIAAIGG